MWGFPLKDETREEKLVDFGEVEERRRDTNTNGSRRRSKRRSTRRSKRKTRSKSVVAWQCNYSDCLMRGNTHFIVPSERFELLRDSKQFIMTYTYGTHTAKHTFCKVCGITSFYTRRSNPDGVAVTFRCVDLGTLTHVEIKQFDGQNWDDSYNLTGISLCSKEGK
ncbi:uncharacterized protein LOC131332804 [Rhododendron vialii]|uniref:uncharacterized protein LOC131332804 n=1 Tax=Rhododendron vialii TaxID=182163 RepID=UPI00265E96E1|nr:uncharacterized protein LOC131332804 [Rhododendron vialii]